MQSRSLVGLSIVLDSIAACCLATVCLAGGSHAAATRFVDVDTTPPTVSAPSPAGDSTVDRIPVISAEFADAGSGIRVSSARIRLDGRDVTSQARITAKGFSLHLPETFNDGIHRLEVTVSDRAGNESNRLAWRFGLRARVPVTVGFRDGMLTVNGERTFPIGIYNYSCFPESNSWEESRLGEVTSVPQSYPFDESRLAEVVRAGFNFMLYKSGSQRELDILEQHGMKVLLETIYTIEKCTDRESAKKALVDCGPARFRNHPALLGYWADSPDATFGHKGVPEEVTVRKMTLAHEVLNENDPRHPLVWCFGWMDSLPSFINTGDAAMSFFYPVGQRGGFKAPDICRYVIDRLKAAAEAAGKPAWFISQGIDLSIEYEGRKPAPEKFRPTVPEMRLMNYLALVSGVKGLCIYGSGGSNYPGIVNNLVEYPAQWNEAMKTGTEVRYLSPVLVWGKPVRTAEHEKANEIPTMSYREWEYKGTHMLIAVNITESPVSATWRFSKPVRPMVLFENRAMAGKSERMKDDFEPYGVHIYQWK